jgi:hypothetical protein
MSWNKEKKILFSVQKESPKQKRWTGYCEVAHLLSRERESQKPPPPPPPTPHSLLTHTHRQRKPPYGVTLNKTLFYKYVGQLVALQVNPGQVANQRNEEMYTVE